MEKDAPGGNRRRQAEIGCDRRRQVEIGCDRRQQARRSPMKETRIEAAGLSVGYEKVVVEGVDLALRPGSILALIGPNGAGKSTILKTITKHLKKKAGVVYLAGEDMEGVAESKLAKSVAIVSTQRIHPELMSCREVVAMGRYPYTGRFGILRDEDHEAVDEAMELVGAKDMEKVPFAQLSDGQRQRIMLARAICQEPDILVLDEPTSFLDIQYKLDLLGVIRRLSIERQIAVIMSIHDLEFVPAIADQCMVVADGRAWALGSPEKIITGDNLEQFYHMTHGEGEMVARGLLDYSKKLKELLCQR